MSYFKSEYFEENEILGGANEYIIDEHKLLTDPDILQNDYNFAKKLDIKENNVVLKDKPYISSIKGGNVLAGDVLAGDYFDDSNANQNQIIDVSRLETELKQKSVGGALKPLDHVVKNNTECADLAKKQGESCLPAPILNEVLQSNNAKTLYEAKQKTACDSEKCVAERTDSQLAIFFKQPGPYSTTKWLSNSNIDTVLASFAAHNPKFLHIPFHMINFAERPHLKINNINWQDASRRYDSAAGAINTDTYERMKGKHWFAVYVSFKDKTIEYFDSAARDRSEIDQWIETAKRQLPDYTVKKNTIQHQKGATECGMYTLYFIAARLLFNIKFEEFQKMSIDDEYMHLFRKYLFH
jgi:hypothetical protein